MIHIFRQMVGLALRAGRAARNGNAAVRTCAGGSPGGRALPLLLILLLTFALSPLTSSAQNVLRISALPTTNSLRGSNVFAVTAFPYPHINSTSGAGGTYQITLSNLIQSINAQPNAPSVTENIIYLNASQSNLVVSTVAAMTSGQMLKLGPGTFTLASAINCVNEGITIQGSGMYVTKLVGASGILIPNVSCKFSDFTAQAPTPVSMTFYECTNVFFDRIYMHGTIDVIFGAGFGLDRVFTIRNCVLASTWDFIMLQGSILNSYLVQDSDFVCDMLDPPGVNAARTTRFVTGWAGTLHVRNCTFTYTNALAPKLYSFDDSGAPASFGMTAYFDNVTFRGAVTNGGRAFPYFFENINGGTNSRIFFRGCDQITTTTNAQSYTNQYGPETVIMTAATVKTNFLPPIAFGGVERYSFPVTIKDGNGSAAANNLQIVPLGGPTIDGAAQVTINVNWGSVTVMPRPGTTNWMVVSRGQ